MASAPPPDGCSRCGGLARQRAGDHRRVRLQARKANATAEDSRSLLWRDGAIAQEADPFLIKGRPYILFTDEFGAGGRRRQSRLRAEPAAVRLCPHHRHRRRDESEARVAAEAGSRRPGELRGGACRLAWAAASATPATTAPSTTRPRRDSPRAAISRPACACSTFRIRIGRRRSRTTSRRPGQGTIPGSNHAIRTTDKRTADWASSNIRWLRRGNDTYLWFTSQDNGFQIVRFTNALASIGQSMAGRDPVRDLP